jgi:crotonobetainyl-CoA:carnitine CoA-transferase CaiB-like acyl-CoA transferase
MRRPGSPDSNRSQWPPMAPHGIYPARGDDRWLAIACRDDRDWRALAAEIGEEWAASDRFAELGGRLVEEDELDALVGAWTRERDDYETAERLRRAGLPAAAVARPVERVDECADTRDWGLWPTVHHTKMGDVRVDGLPVHFSKTDWQIRRGAPCLGEHNQRIYGDLLGLSAAEIDELRASGVL